MVYSTIIHILCFMCEKFLFEVWILRVRNTINKWGICTFFFFVKEKVFNSFDKRGIENSIFGITHSLIWMLLVNACGVYRVYNVLEFKLSAQIDE